MALVFVDVLSRKMLHTKSASSCCQGPEVGGHVFFYSLLENHCYFREFFFVRNLISRDERKMYFFQIVANVFL